MEFGSRSARHDETIRGYKIMHMIWKGQVEKWRKGVKERIKFIAEIFGMAA